MDKLKDCFRSIVELFDEKSLVVQLVALSNPEQQIDPYLDTLRSAGLVESDICWFDGSSELASLAVRPKPKMVRPSEGRFAREARSPVGPQKADVYN